MSTRRRFTGPHISPRLLTPPKPESQTTAAKRNHAEAFAGLLRRTPNTSTAQRDRLHTRINRLGQKHPDTPLPIIMLSSIAEKDEEAENEEERDPDAMSVDLPLDIAAEENHQLGNDDDWKAISEDDDEGEESRRYRKRQRIRSPEPCTYMRPPSARVPASAPTRVLPPPVCPPTPAAPFPELPPEARPGLLTGPQVRRLGSMEFAIPPEWLDMLNRTATEDDETFRTTPPAPLIRLRRQADKLLLEVHRKLLRISDEQNFGWSAHSFAKSLHWKSAENRISKFIAATQNAAGAKLATFTQALEPRLTVDMSEYAEIHPVDRKKHITFAVVAELFRPRDGQRIAGGQWDVIYRGRMTIHADRLDEGRWRWASESSEEHFYTPEEPRPLGLQRHDDEEDHKLPNPLPVIGPRACERSERDDLPRW